MMGIIAGGTSRHIRKSGGDDRVGSIGIHAWRQRRSPEEGNMTTAYYSTVLEHPLGTVWSLIRDFNNYPAYIDGVSESVIEDDKRGDEVGAVRRFCYRGNWIR
jgi:hypothetical protein